jgi:hypothetical protein
MPGLTRRQSIATLAIGGGAVGLAGIVMEDDARFIRSVLTRAFGKFRMADDQFSAFVVDFRHDDRDRPTGALAVMHGLSSVGVDRLPGQSFELMQDARAYERRVVTHFVTRTDYTMIDPGADMVNFTGKSGGCVSPFARFDGIDGDAA